MLCGIFDCCPNFVGVIFFCECACGANSYALTAVDTCCVCQRHIKCRTDVCGKSSVVAADNAHMLVLSAHCHASAAENALGVVSYEMNRRVINVGFCGFVAVFVHIHAVFAAEFLQFAVCGTHA